MWLEVNYLTKLPVFDIVLLFRWTLDGLIVFLAMKRGYSGEKNTSPKCKATLENINWLFENVKKNKMSNKKIGCTPYAIEQNNRPTLDLGYINNNNNRPTLDAC